MPRLLLPLVSLTPPPPPFRPRLPYSEWDARPVFRVTDVTRIWGLGLGSRIWHWRYCGVRER